MKQTELNAVFLKSHSLDEMNCLLAQGANVHAVDQEGNTRLHLGDWGKENTFVVVSKLFLDGADLAALNDKGETPLLKHLKAWNMRSADPRYVEYVALLMAVRDNLNYPRDVKGKEDALIKSTGINFDRRIQGYQRYNKEGIQSLNKALLRNWVSNAPKKKTLSGASLRTVDDETIADMERLVMALPAATKRRQEVLRAWQLVKNACRNRE